MIRYCEPKEANEVSFPGRSNFGWFKTFPRYCFVTVWKENVNCPKSPFSLSPLVQGLNEAFARSGALDSHLGCILHFSFAVTLNRLGHSIFTHAKKVPWMFLAVPFLKY